MPKVYRVDSYHLNINVGDAAIHVLAYEDGGNTFAEKVLWVDGGVGSGERLLNFENSVIEIAKKYSNLNGQEVKFDTIIVSHWDNDHYGGVAYMLRQEHVKARKYLRYPGTTTKPMTQMYFPSGMALKGIRPVVEYDSKSATGYIMLNNAQGIRTQMARIIAGVQLLGSNLFVEGNKGFHRISHLTELMKMNNAVAPRPSLYCIAVDEVMIADDKGKSWDPDPVAEKDEWEQVAEGDIIWNDSPTKTNESSIAAILVWPNQRISHYIAGDLGALLERRITAWLWQDCKILSKHRITSIKASHHGSASSTPPTMLTNLRPKNFIISAGSKHNHPDWELMVVLDEYVSFMTAAGLTLGRGPVLLTNYPTWLVPGSKLTPTQFNMEYFDDDLLKAVKGKRKDKIIAFKKFMDETKNSMFGHLFTLWESDSFATQTDGFDELRKEFWARGDTLIGNYDEVEKSESEWVRIASYENNLSDGAAFQKLRTQPETELTENIPQIFKSVKPGLFGKKNKKAKSTANNKKKKKEIIKQLAQDDSDTEEYLGRVLREGGSMRSARIRLRQKMSKPIDKHLQMFSSLQAMSFELPQRSIISSESHQITGLGYCLWASLFQGERTTRGRILEGLDPFDDFLCETYTRLIRLVDSPSNDGTSLEASDELVQWMTSAIKALKLSLVGSETSIESIRLELSNGLIFDTAVANSALRTAFKTYNIPSQGLLLGNNNKVMVFGLQTAKKDRWLLSDICSFFGQLYAGDNTKAEAVSLSAVAEALSKSSWRLDPVTPGNRNTVWFAPFMNQNTVVRLAFALENSAVDDGPIAMLKAFWPDGVTLRLKDASLVCRFETYLVCQNEKGMSTKSNTKINFFGTLVATIDTISVELQIGLELTSSSSGSLTVQSNAPANNFTEFGYALVQKICGSRDLPGIDKVKDSGEQPVRFRQLRLDIADGKFKEAAMTIEVSTHLGKRSNGQNVAIRFDAGFRSGSGLSGLYLCGSLWFPIPRNPLYPPHYYSDWEPFYELNPLTPKASPILWLPALLPDTIDVSQLPNNIPQVVVDAQFVLTIEGLAVSATIMSCNPYEPHENLPSIDFSELSVSAAVNWKTPSLELALECRVALNGPADSDNVRPTCTNELIGVFTYNSSGKTWSFSASAQELQLGMLYDYFAHDSRDLLYDVLKEINICNLMIEYVSNSEEKVFSAEAEFLISERWSIPLTYKHSSKGNWEFQAKITDAKLDSQIITLLDIVRSVAGESSSLVTGLPDFIANAEIVGKNAGGASLQLQVNKHGEDGVRLKLVIKLGYLEATFIQLQSQSRKEKGGKGSEDPIRYFQLSLGGIKLPGELPLLDDFKPPFDKLAVVWVNTALSAEDVAAIQSVQSDQTGGAAQAAPAKKGEGMVGGFHFIILSASTVVLDYPIGKARAQPRDTKDLSQPATKKDTPGTDPKSKEKSPPVGQIDSRSPKTPLKKSQGPLTINDIQLHYKENVLSVQMDAIFAIGPLTFALLGFQIGLDLKGGLSISKFDLKNIHVDLEGLAVSFKRPPLTIEGGLIHRKDALSDIYAGGITIGFTPWLFQAAGFYGKTKVNAQSNDEFTSALVYAILRGPLITLEFATISGITGGFGYNVGIAIPSVADVYKFPLVSPPAETDIVTTLKSLIKETPNAPRWFYPQDGAMWLAAGLTVSAFEMLDVTAVLVAQWSPQIQFHVLGLATADVPSTKSPVKLAHVELGFVATVDVPTGLFSVEAQLSPNSYILDPSCHLSGGFALFYWFKDSAAGRAGEFVFTIGGYHSAFQIPPNYPRPPRLAISWALGDSLAIRGEAYFAITPKACMAGLHINAVLSLGPLRAWFDAYADFLVNYAPFNFQAVGHVSVGVAYNMDAWFIHIHISVEIGATLYICGPPIAGTVHVDFWVFGFDIDFGSSKKADNGALSITDFYKLALEADSKEAQRNTAKPKTVHVYSCFGGLIPKEEKSEKGSSQETKQDDLWRVRGGPFIAGITSYIAINSATINGESVPAPADGNKDKIYAKPMRLSEELTSTLEITVMAGKNRKVTGWRLQPLMKSVPSALWGQYDSRTDPTHGSGGNNSISSLLATDNACLRLMMGVELRAPEAKISENKLAPIDVKKAFIAAVSPAKNTQFPFIPASEPTSQAWEPELALPPPKRERKPRKVAGGSNGKEKETAVVEAMAKIDQSPATTAPEKNQWTAVSQAWSAANAQPTVNKWSELMGWKSPLSAPCPKSLLSRAEQLWLQAPHLCVQVTI